MLQTLDVAIVGAGPYALSLAVHLKKRRVKFRIFGKPMGTWQSHMPFGMSLKSEGFASNIHHPDGLLTLQDFCRESNIPYAHIGIPVKLTTFSAYGLAFQQRFVPEVTDTLVTSIEADKEHFRVSLGNGEYVRAKHVVIAAGITHFKHIPPVIAGLPPELVSHSSQYHKVDEFKGRNVAVIGAGSSAVDVAAALHDAGARASLITRRSHVPFHGKAPDKRPLMTRIRAPWSGLGPSWRSRLACDLPLVFHAMPYDFRLKVVRKHLGPAPGWFTRDKIVGNVPMHVGVSVAGATIVDGKVHLQLSGPNQENTEVIADHVIAGTGYRVDVKSLKFLSAELGDRVKTESGSPILSSSFESSVPGLYFVGTTAALSFGPLLRFTFGAEFASKRISRHLASRVRVKAYNGAKDAAGEFPSSMRQVELTRSDRSH